jgi:hypothetical protein
MALPAAAEAATVGYSAGTITYTTAKGEANHVTVEPFGYSLKITESGTKSTGPVTLTTASGCFPLSWTSAACPATAMRLSADLTDGNDFFDASLAAVPVSVKGGPGNDVLRGGSGVDTLDGGGEDDSFDARDSVADKVMCGPGTDIGDVDALDTLSADCEGVQRPVIPAGPDPTPPTDPVVDPPSGTTGPGTTDPGTTDSGTTDPGTTGPGTTTDPGTTDPGGDPPAANLVPVTIPRQTVAVSASGVASVRVACPADSGGCSGTVRLVLPSPASARAHARVTASAARSHAPVTLGSAKFSAKAGTSPVVQVRLSKRGRQRILRSRRGKRARIVITTRRADGTTSTASQDVTVRLKRQPAKGRRSRRR